MPSTTKTRLALSAATLALLSTSACSSSHSSAHTSADAKSFCTNASNFLKASMTSSPLKTKEQIKTFDDGLRDKASAVSKSAPNDTLAASWKTLASYYEASAKGDASAATKMSQAQQNSMGDALQDAQSRCHIDLQGSPTSTPSS